MSFIIRRAEDRGHADHGWLDTRHTFSFADYYDRNWMGFRTLRVINEDVIQPGQGFGMHHHRDMEILTYVMAGALRHTDSMGNTSVLSAGEVQRMSAGTGVMHSEMNPSDSEPCHLYQIWLTPEQANLKPEYQQLPFWGHLEQQGKVLVASRDGHDHSLRIHQQVELWLHRLKEGESTTLTVLNEKAAWLQVIAGTAKVGLEEVKTGDGIAANSSLNIVAITDLEVMEFVL